MADKKWVSIKTRLPENYQEVLAYDESLDKVIIAQYHSLNNTWTSAYLLDDGEHISWWTPIPAIDF